MNTHAFLPWTAALTGLLLASPSTTRADDAPLTCIVRGDVVVKAGTQLFDQGSGGNAVAKLTGAKAPLTISHIPNRLKGRLRARTSKGSGAIRIDGWANRSAFRFFAATDIPIVNAHVWVTKGQELEVVGASAKELKAKHKVLGSVTPPVEVTIPCDALALAIPALEDLEPERGSRTFQMKSDTIDLYDGPGGKVVFTLQMDEGARKVFWSKRSRAGYLHITSRGDITIDAWVRGRDVSFLRHAELFDLANVMPKPTQEKKLALSDPPAALVADAELPIHHKPENAPTAIGYVEPGARFYAMEISGAWTNIMPESLAVLPSDGSGFWVRTSGLPQPKSPDSKSPDSKSPDSKSPEPKSPDSKD